MSVTGTYFADVQYVKFGSNTGTSVTTVNESNLTVVAPAGATGTVNVLVSTLYGTSVGTAENQYQYIATPLPTIASINPNKGSLLSTTNTVITGTNFDYSPVSVKFGGVVASSSSVDSRTTINAVAPAGNNLYGVVDTQITNFFGSSIVTSNDKFTYPPYYPATSFTQNPNNLTALVTFTAPAIGNTEGITSYNVTSGEGGISGSTASPGSITLSGFIDGSVYNFTSTCTNAAGVGLVSPPTTITASGTPLSTSLQTSPSNSTTYTSGDTITFTPSFSNGKTVTISYMYKGSTEFVNVPSTASGSPARDVTIQTPSDMLTTVFYLNVANTAGDTASSRAFKNVPIVAFPTSSISANPQSINNNSSSQLVLAYTGGNASVETQGGAVISSPYIVSPTSSTTYRLRVTNNATSPKNADSVTTVTVYPLPSISSFTASPNPLDLNQQNFTNVIVNVSNAVAGMTGSFSGGGINQVINPLVSGPYKVYPTQITTLNLTVYNAIGGTGNSSLILNVPFTTQDLGDQDFYILPLQSSYTPIRPIVPLGGKPPYTFAKLGSPPSGGPEYSLNTSTGVVQVTTLNIPAPMTDQTYTSSVTVRDSTPTTLNKTFQLIVPSPASENAIVPNECIFVNSFPSDVLTQADLVNSVAQSLLALNPSTTIIYYVNLKPGSTIGEVGANALLNGTDSINPVANGEQFFQFIPCLLPTSKILMGDGDTYKCITEIKAGDMVYSAFTDEPVEVVSCKCKIVTSYDVIPENNRVFKVPQDNFGKGIPMKDVFISGYHRIIVNNRDGKTCLGVQTFKFKTFDVLSETEAQYLSPDRCIYYYNIEVIGGANAVYCDGLPVETYVCDL